MEESWDFEFVSRMVDSLVSFLSEFVDDWLANDMRVAVFKILFIWLILSLIAIHFAWKMYGNTVNDMYYRQGKDRLFSWCIWRVQRYENAICVTRFNLIMRIKY